VGIGRAPFGVAVAVLASACTTQPPYQRPLANTPNTWANGSTYTVASGGTVPASNRAAWWVALHDPAIDALIAAALADNPTLAEAAARVDQASAAVASSRAQRLPRIGLATSAQQARVAAVGTGGTESTIAQSSALVGPSLSWEIDLWGRLKETVRVARSRLQARDADASSARLSITAQVADNVLALRASDLLLYVRDADIISRTNELAILRVRVRHGSLAPADAATAESNLASVRINRISQVQVSKEILDALVALTGLASTEVRAIVAVPQLGLPTVPGPPQYVSVDLAGLMPSAPAIVAGIPATVLGHPDLVAAEREVAARWSEIAVARAERKPRLDLTAILTGQWISTLGFFASLLTGSLGAGLSGPLFDAGAGKAEVRRADAFYREAVATLNVTLRRAARDIEDGLAAQESAILRVDVSRSAVSAARVSLRANDAR
jgi:NodT family efflux transporter outer membrane factor (OMF) lipoprotein